MVESFYLTGNPVKFADRLDGGLQKVATSSYLLLMRIVGIKDLKNQLSEYVRAAAGGETVLVTDRNRVVAELVPPASGRSAAPSDALLAEAVRQGWITPPPLGASGVPPRRPVAPFDDFLAELREDRDSR